MLILDKRRGKDVPRFSSCGGCKHINIVDVFTVPGFIWNLITKSSVEITRALRTILRLRLGRPDGPQTLRVFEGFLHYELGT